MREWTIQENILRKRNSMCNGPGVGAFQVCLRNSKEVMMAWAGKVMIAEREPEVFKL